MMKVTLLVLSLGVLLPGAVSFAPGMYISSVGRLGGPRSQGSCRQAGCALVRLRGMAEGNKEEKKSLFDQPDADTGLRIRNVEEETFDTDIKKGKDELAMLKQMTDAEAEALRQRLNKKIDEAMMSTQNKVLEEYDAKTKDIITGMRKDMDVIRQESENLKKLQEEIETGRYWKGKSKKKQSVTQTVATVLAYTFAFAAFNEIYGGLISDEGISFIGGLKAVVDSIFAGVSTYIANKTPKKEDEED